MINESLARKYCKEDISKIKNCSAKDLIENDCYYNRKACELVFLTKAEHTRMHLKGKHHTEESRRKLREASRRRWTLHKKKINGGTVNGCDF